MSLVIKHKRKSICFAFFNYWIVLLLWQNLAGAVNRGMVDSMVKLLLLSYLLFSFLKKRGSFDRTAGLIFVVFVASQAITFALSDLRAFAPTVLITYLFPSIYIYLTFIHGRHFTVEPDDIYLVNKYIRIVVLISVFYTLVFEPSQYINAIRATNAYGNELHSFFASMYEYALYLFYCITTCLKEISEREIQRERVPQKYYIMVLIYFITLILTFSRTAIIGCLVYFAVYAVFYRRTKLSNQIVCLLFFGAIVILSIPSLRHYAFSVVWKEGISHSRDRLQAYAIDYYRNGTILQKLFGHGIIQTRNTFTTEQIYGSVHNGYLQVLLYYGIIGLFFLSLFLFRQMISVLKFVRIDHLLGSMGVAYLLFCILSMISTTLILFFSSIECFFLTTMLIVIPMYERNAVLRTIR